MSQILVPYDGSDNAREALAFACETFGGKEILVLFVVDTSVTYQPERVVGMKLGDIYEKREAEGKEHLADAEELADEHGVEVETTLAHGKPSRTILEEIEKTDIDHVVLGSHSQSALERLFLGSVAERVVERSPASVTVIRG